MVGLSARAWRIKTETGIGKQWKPTKTAFRPKAGVSKSWDIKMKEKAALQAMKAKEKELKDEKEAEKQVRGVGLGWWGNC